MSEAPGEDRVETKAGEWLLLVTAWSLVCVPLGWGIFQTLKKALILFK